MHLLSVGHLQYIALIYLVYNKCCCHGLITEITTDASDLPSKKFD